jgi:multiple antibiotic resistance protein
MPAELRQIIEGVLFVFAALLPIVNPFAGAPMFLALTGDCTPALRASLARRVARNAFLLLLGSVFVGNYVLAFFGLSVPVVQVAGGLIVCGLGWELLRQDSTAPNPEHAVGPDPVEMRNRAFYPLTLPLTVGPGTISVAITIGANHSYGMRSLLVNSASELVGVTAIAATIFVCYRYADRMLRALGATGTSVMVRLSAFILLCIGVQIFWNGVSALIGTLPGARG